jgi:hexokinase
MLPDGTEEGEYLALDLGGTNFRTLFVQLEKGRLVKEEVKFFHVPESLRLGPGVALFDFLAACIHQFMEEHHLLNRRFSLGFTFSFPMYQKSLDCGILVSWTKTFNCEGVVGQDAVQMLNDAIQKRGDLNVEVTAILNDTTGTLIQGAYTDKNTAIGLILGTGSNACYIEKAERIHNWEGVRPPAGTEVIIDIEWGAFGDNGVLDFIRTEFDREVDNNSLLVNSFTFEKYFAGKYLGEIVRVVLVRLAQAGVLFDGDASDKLLCPGIFTAKLVSEIEEDSINDSFENTRVILEDFQLNFGTDDMTIVKHVCYVITVRAAKLISICLAAILERMARPSTVTIAIDGSLFQFHPRLETLMTKYIADFAPERKFLLTLAEDGSGKGAGLVAAIAKRLKNKKV